MYFEIEKQAIDAISDALDKFEVDDTLENFQVEDRPLPRRQLPHGQPKLVLLHFHLLKN